uniref:Thioredoxin-like fold domain-containing protein n=1 Tax=Entomoneis paludosa TaxID=265537 RepID=A0A7S2YP98_9STRA
MAALSWKESIGNAQAVQEETVATAKAVADEEEVVDLDAASETDTAAAAASAQPEAVTEEAAAAAEETTATEEPPVQSGPLVDLFGPTLLSLELTGPSTAQLKEHYTTDALQGKKVIGVYFSADWCGPCRQFTPELSSFYEKINSRRGKIDEFEIVWVSRCRDMQSFGQYFTTMPWIALPPQEAMGARGEKLSQMYGVKSIPALVLLDDLGSVITTDARNMIPKDKAGIGFPWRNPISTLYMTVVPRSLRLMLKRELGSIKEKAFGKVKGLLNLRAKGAKA